MVAAIALAERMSPGQRQFADSFEHRRRYCPNTYKSIVAVLEIGPSSARRMLLGEQWPADAKMRVGQVRLRQSSSTSPCGSLGHLGTCRSHSLGPPIAFPHG
jgi:hypothetical protein